MQFKEAVDYKTMLSYSTEIQRSIQAIEEYGHCVNPSDNVELEIVQNKAKDIIGKLKIVEEALSDLLEHQYDWYGY